MKGVAQQSRKITLIGLTALFSISCCAFAGDLEPPASPVPTMKTLTEIEPRTTIESLAGDADSLYIITDPGSYYLTGNISSGVKHGITIAADNVTIDLNGFSVIGMNTGGRDGITSSGGHYNVVVKNGIVRNWANGIVLRGYNFRCSELIVMDNNLTGIWAENNAQILKCEARNNLGGIGFHVEGYGAEFKDCIAQNNVVGFGAFHTVLAVNCVAHNNSSSGFDIGFAATITDCVARENTDGITTNRFCAITRCTVVENGNDGIWVRDSSTVRECNLVNNHNIGIFVRESGSGCRIESNVVTGSDVGIKILDDPGVHNHIVLKNSCSNDTTSYDMGSGNAYGPIIDVSGAGDMAGVPGAEHPWANFEF